MKSDAHIATTDDLRAPTEQLTTPSGIPIPQVATANMHANRQEVPGEYPYTRGIFADGYRGRLWTMRQYSGFGTAEESNQRYRFLLEQGQTGLSVAFDLPTQCGYDPTDPIAAQEVGKVGVSVSNLREMEILFQGIDLVSHLGFVYDQWHRRNYLCDVPGRGR